MTSPRKPLRTRRGGGRVVWGGDACVAHTHLRIDRTTQDWCKPLHRLDGPIRRIVGASPCGRPGTGPRRNLPDVGSCRLDIYQSRCSWRWASLQLLYVGANRLPEKGPLVKYWYHVNGTAPATCAHHWKESVDGSSAPDKSRPVPTTAR